MLKDPGRLLREHVAVDGIRHSQRAPRRDQSQIANVLEVPVAVRGVATAEQRLDHPAHARLAQLVRQLVEMRVPLQDQRLARNEDIALREGFPGSFATPAAKHIS